jgi:hypothetical protein
MGKVWDSEMKQHYIWKPQEQLYPTSTRLERYFASDGYREFVAQYSQPIIGRFRIDWDYEPLAIPEQQQQQQQQHLRQHLVQPVTTHQNGVRKQEQEQVTTTIEQKQ